MGRHWSLAERSSIHLSVLYKFCHNSLGVKIGKRLKALIQVSIITLPIQCFFHVPSGMMLSRQLPDYQQEYQRNGGER